MYIAKFQDNNGYWFTLDGASFDEAFRFLNYNTSNNPRYMNAFMREQDSGREVISLRTIK